VGARPHNDQVRLEALIVDDERLARKELRSLLAAHPEVSVVGEADSVAAALAFIEGERPDLLFLDIQLAGETGFDLLERVRAADFRTIFVTAFDAYAIRAFEVNALDYLLKPVNPGRLKKALDKLLPGAAGAAPAPPARPLAIDDRLYLELGGRSVFLKVGRVTHVTAAGDYSEVFTADGERLLVEKPLREWEARLPEKFFSRIHRNCIVNLEYVERMEGWFNRSHQLFLRGRGEPLTVSRRYAARLKEKFG
jgi:two-component system, LytTR family, response regulator